MATWFESLMGFRETTPAEVRENITLDARTMTSNVNGATFQFGNLLIPTLAELRETVEESNEDRSSTKGRLRIREVIASVQDLHQTKENAGAMFQVASQFNLLEMVSPAVTPERGVGTYQSDFTQGPACAISCGAATIYRNYFVPIGNQIGQTEDRQIDCLADLGNFIGNDGGRFWTMQNGYALATRAGLAEFDRRFQLNEQEVDEMRKRIRVGLQWYADVTLPNANQRVSQAFCSAVPVAYSRHSTNEWESMARLVLEAAYEATFCAAVLNRNRTGNQQLFLTLLGGGAFGNRDQWIIEAIERAARIFAHEDLDVGIVSYRRSHKLVRNLVAELEG